jgi:peptidoglycan/LPS O-acetylase OafA/YrhL
MHRAGSGAFDDLPEDASAMTATTAPRLESETQQRRVFRTDIQAMRALAILLVVLTHLWPTRFSGGYVGVDVFFVISGFLITGHLMSELTRTGGVRLGRFYARRIRRLIPAALTVLAASLALAFAYLPYPRWERNAWEVLSSAGYVENWFLASKSVNYSAMNDAASAVQHYWSLSVEEQFYILWPLVLVLAGTALLRSRRGKGDVDEIGMRRRALTVIVVIGVVSFVLSVAYTMLYPAPAYFATFTRAWEFAIGGAVAMAGPRLRLPRLIRNLLSIVGIALIASTGFVYDHTTPFPGAYAAVPVIGAALIIAAGTASAGESAAPLWHDRLTAIGPIQWLGAVSYSLYLWHWPLIVIAPFVLGTSLTGPTRLGILAVSLVLAGLTKRFIEDGGQRWRFWKESTPRAFTLMLTGFAIIAVGVTGVLSAYYPRAEADRPPATIVQKPCVGPEAMEPGANCPDPFGRVGYSLMTSKNEYFYTPPECGEFLSVLTYGDKRTTLNCDFSAGASNPTHVALVGDSHAQQWQGAVFDLARKKHWVVTTSYYGGCPATDAEFIGFRSAWGAPDAQACRQWSKDLSEYIIKKKPDIVLTTMAARDQLADDGSGRSQAQQMTSGLESYWKRWRAAGIRVLPIINPPYNAEVRPADCLVLNEKDPVSCARPTAEANPTDPIATAARDLRIPALDLTDRFCDATSCYAAIGGVPVYYDADHLNLEYVRLLGPEIGKAIDAAIAAKQ